MTIFNPITFFWIFSIIAFVLYKRKKEKAGKFLLITAFTGLFIFSVTPLPVYMLHHLESKYAAYRNPNNTKLPILVLGNNHSDDPTLFPNQQLSVHSLERVTEGVRIYRSFSGSTIAFSGFAINGKQPTASVMAKTALTMGVSPKDTIMLTQPSSTWQEAQDYKKRFGTKNKFILVTSATHLPRAMQIFKSMGMQPIPAPADFFIKDDGQNALYNWKPSSFKLLYTEITLYEYLLQGYYKWFKN